MRGLIYTPVVCKRKHIVSIIYVLITLFASKSIALDAYATQPTSSASEQQQILGAYLARAGNCMGCHTTKGGTPFAGGRRMYTSFGIFITPNITPDKETGIGYWSKDHFGSRGGTHVKDPGI